MIGVDDLVVQYGERSASVRAVENVSFSVESGGTVALIGPSGCGKTSILFAMAGLLVPASGCVNIGGEAVNGPRRDVALILQNAGLLPWKTVQGNANLSLRLAGEASGRGAAEVLDELGLGGQGKRYPSELSEGMKRRVGIARALSVSPTVMLMDEPLAALDTLTRERIQGLFLTLWQEHRFSLVLVTHDIEEAAFLGQRILVLTERPARVKATVDNPGMGDLNYRGTERYRQTVSALRQELER